MKPRRVYVIEMRHRSSPLWHPVEADTSFRRAHAEATLWQQNNPDDLIRVVKYQPKAERGRGKPA